MKRRKSIIILSVIIGVLAAALVLTFLNLSGISGYRGSNPYRGFTGTIEANMGVQSQGGVVLVYRAQQTETKSKVSYATQLEARMTLMRVALRGEEGKNNALISTNSDVARQGFDKIRIESMSTSAPRDVSDLVEDKLGEKKNAEIAFVDGMEQDIIGGHVIRNVRLFMRLSNYILEIEVTDEGRAALEKSSIQAISIIDKTAKNAGGEESSYLIGKLPDDFFTEGKMSSNKITFKEFSNSNDMYIKYFKLIAGSRPLALTLLSADAVNSNNAHSRAVLALLAGVAAAVLLSAFLIIRYKGLGIAAAVSFLGCFTVLLFFAAVLPFASLSFTALGVITLMMLLNAGSYILTFENIKEEYAKGKSVQASAAAGFKKAFWPLFDIHLFAAIAGAGLWILGSGALLSAGMIILFASALSMAASAGLCRYLLNLTMSVFGDDMNPSLFNLKDSVKGGAADYE